MKRNSPTGKGGNGKRGGSSKDMITKGLEAVAETVGRFTAKTFPGTTNAVDMLKADHAQVKQLFEDLANLATSEVKSNGEFVLPGFGKLVRSNRKAREGRNPATGETIQIPAKTTLKFRVGKAMKDSVLPRK